MRSNDFFRNDFFREAENISRDVASRIKEYLKTVNVEFEARNQTGNETGGSFRPLVDITEDNTNLYVRAEIAGANKEELHVAMRGGSALEISGVKARNISPEERDVRVGERRFGNFSRMVELPERVEIDQDNITASYRDGVLTVTLPKSKAQEIPINVI